jgi:hypothetical protein
MIIDPQLEMFQATYAWLKEEMRKTCAILNPRRRAQVRRELDLRMMQLHQEFNLRNP